MILKNEFLEVEITEFGASIVSIKVPDKNGEIIDVVLGYDNLESYKKQDKYIGTTIGRSSSRIADGLIKINGKQYKLNCNERNIHSNGGMQGFDKKFWQGAKGENTVSFNYLSKDGEENYPGNLNVNLTYTLKKNALFINYKAVSDKDTVCNLTNHSYFNLNGKGDILAQEVQIFADYFMENDENSLTTGKIIPVENTPMDFRKPKKIGADIKSNYYQVKYANGFDNNWVVKDYNGRIKKAARAFSKKSGIELVVQSNLPGVQFYSGNFLDGAAAGKNNVPIKNHSGFCLKCHYLPNTSSNKNFPLPILRAGEVYDKTIKYKFKHLYS